MIDDYKPVDASSPMGQMLEKAKNMRPISPSAMSIYSQIDVSKIGRSEIKAIPLAEHIERSEEYQRQSLEMLRSINDNTANLSVLVDLISESNEKQDEMLELISEILTIAKAKEKKEADSLFKKVSEKINGSVETVDSIIKLTGWAVAIYQMVLSKLPQ